MRRSPRTRTTVFPPHALVDPTHPNDVWTGLTSEEAGAHEQETSGGDDSADGEDGADGGPARRMELHLDAEPEAFAPLGPDGRTYALVSFICLPERGTSAWDSGYLVLGAPRDGAGATSSENAYEVAGIVRPEGVTVGADDSSTPTGAVTGDATGLPAPTASPAGNEISPDAYPLASTSTVSYLDTDAEGARFRHSLLEPGDALALPSGEEFSLWQWSDDAEAVVEAVRSPDLTETYADGDYLVVLTAPIDPGTGRHSGGVAGVEPGQPAEAFALVEERLGEPDVSTDEDSMSPEGFRVSTRTWSDFTAEYWNPVDENAGYFGECMAWTIGDAEAAGPGTGDAAGTTTGTDASGDGAGQKSSASALLPEGIVWSSPLQVGALLEDAVEPHAIEPWGEGFPGVQTVTVGTERFTVVTDDGGTIREIMSGLGCTTT